MKKKNGRWIGSKTINDNSLNVIVEKATQITVPSKNGVILKTNK